MAQQEFAQPMTRTELVLLRRLPRADQISQRFVRGIRHPHRGQVARPVGARQFLGIASIGLDPIAGLRRYQRRCHDVTVHTEADQLPVQHVAGRASFVAHAQLIRRAQLPDQAADGLWSIRHRAERADLTGGFGDGDHEGFRVDIKTDKSYVSHGPTLLSRAALRRVLNTHSVIRASRNGGRSFSCSESGAHSRSAQCVHSD